MVIDVEFEYEGDVEDDGKMNLLRVKGYLFFFKQPILLTQVGIRCTVQGKRRTITRCRIYVKHRTR